MNKKQEEIQLNKSYGLNTFNLKLIALIIMTIDHIGLVFGITTYTHNGNLKYKLSEAFNIETYYILRSIGRLSFPIFCFLLAVGYLHTKNIYKYMLRLLIFGAISQVPFCLAIKNTNYFANFNVYATLLLGLIAIYFYDKIPKIFIHSSVATLLSIGLVIAIAGVAEVINTDYGAYGILLIWLMFLLISPESFLYGRFLFIVIIAAVLTYTLTFTNELIGLLAFIPIYFYNGERGYKTKYAFYAYYPAHLLLFSLLA